MCANVVVKVLKVISKCFTDKTSGQLVNYAQLWFFDETANEVRYYKLKSDLVTQLSALEGEEVSVVLDLRYNKIIGIA